MIFPLRLKDFNVFNNNFTYEFLNQLLQLRDIPHAIDLTLGSTIPNISHYELSLREHDELQKEVIELI